MTHDEEELLRRQQEARTGQAIPQPGQHSTDPNYQDQPGQPGNPAPSPASVNDSGDRIPPHSETIPDPPTQHPDQNLGQPGPYGRQQAGQGQTTFGQAGRSGVSKMDYDALHTMLLVREKLSGPRVPGHSQTPSLLANITRDLDALEAKTKIDVEAAQKADAEAAAKAAADAVKATAEAAEAKAKVDADAAAAKAKIDNERARANETPDQKKAREDAEKASRERRPGEPDAEYNARMAALGPKP